MKLLKCSSNTVTHRKHAIFTWKYRTNSTSKKKTKLIWNEHIQNIYGVMRNAVIIFFLTSFFGNYLCLSAAVDHYCIHITHHKWFEWAELFSILLNFFVFSRWAKIQYFPILPQFHGTWMLINVVVYSIYTYFNDILFFVFFCGHNVYQKWEKKRCFKLRYNNLFA